MTALAARHAGARPAGGCVHRPCTPDDVVRVLDALYRRGRINTVHATVLRQWGERGHPPSPRYAAEAGAAEVWTEAMRHLTGPLRAKGVVA